jgi:hypothetical protein
MSLQKCFDVLRTKLKPAIRSKNRGKLQKASTLLHDNARAHTANQTVETENELRYGLYDAPAKESRSRPQGFPCVWPNERTLGGRFSADEEITGAV